MARGKSRSLPRHYSHPINIPVFRGSFHQKGYGLGSTIFKNVLPFLKKGLATVGKKALNVGAKALDDIAENNTSVKDAFKNQLHQEYRTLTKGIKRSRSSNSVSARKPSAKKRRRPGVASKKVKGGFQKITL